jgi:serpin B
VVNDLAAIAASSNGFAFDVYAGLRGASGNAVFSPASLWTVLTLACAGARGETAAQMRRVLHLDCPTETTLSLTRRLSDSLAAEDQVVIRVVNCLFGETSIPFVPSFLEAARADTGAAFQPVDFRNALRWLARSSTIGWRSRRRGASKISSPREG